MPVFPVTKLICKLSITHLADFIRSIETAKSNLLVVMMILIFKGIKGKRQISI